MIRVYVTRFGETVCVMVPDRLEAATFVAILEAEGFTHVEIVGGAA